MLQHLGARALRGAEARRQFLGLSEEDADRAADVLRDALAGDGVMTRAECVAALEAAGIPSAGQRAYHLLWYASQKGVTCVGPQRGKEQTFVLLDEFAPPGVDLDRHAALATIAERFVRSHAPVSAHDLARWADITVTDARAGLAAAAGVVPRTIDGRDLFVGRGPARHRAVLDADAGMGAGTDGDDRGTPDREPAEALPARALPGFDELILGYRDRTAQLDADHESLVVPGGNGMFSNTLVVDGRVVGTWRRRELARTVEIVATPFARIAPPNRRRLAGSLVEFGTSWASPAESVVRRHAHVLRLIRSPG